MKQRIFIIHGWGGSTEIDWLPWAKVQLEHKGFEVHTPRMPDTEHPKIPAWIEKLQETTGELRKSDILIGHSIGCQTVLRFLETTPQQTKIKKVILVAPWMTLMNLEELDNEDRIADPWIKTPIDFPKIKNKAGSFIVFFSDNDPWVPLTENKAIFQKQLQPKIAVYHNKGHFAQEEGVTELPELLQYI